MALAVFLGILLAGSLNCGTAQHDTLEFLQVLFRHGNRSAWYSFDEFIPYMVEKFKPYQLGQLTPQGRRQMRNVGSYIRQSYNDFLPEEFSYNDILIKCASMLRVQESSAVAMAAMFPPKDRQIWEDSGLGVDWTPIACMSLPGNQDALLQAYSTDCPRYSRLLQHFYHSRFYLPIYNKLTNNGEVNKYIQHSLNMSSPLDAESLDIVFDNLYTMQDYGIALPSWSSAVWPSPLMELNNVNYGQFYYSREAIRFTIGELLREILNFATLLQERKLTPATRKMVSYFTHDRIIMPFLVALGLETMPPMSSYGAAFILELHRNKSTSDIGYKFVYRNQTWSDPIIYTVPGCEEICPLSYVKKVLEPYIPTKPFYEYC